MNRFPIYPKVTPANFVRWNEEMFKRYNNERVYLHPNPIIRLIEGRRVKTVIKALGKIHSFDTILAAGCGEGYIEKKIATGKLTLVDISKEAIKRAKLALTNRRGVKFAVADLERLPFGKSEFSKIECSEVIEHVLTPRRMLKEFVRVLSDNGVVAISFPNEPLINGLKKILIRWGLFSRFFPNVPADMTEEWHLRAYDLASFERDARGLLKIDRVWGIPFDLLPIRYVVRCSKKT